MLICFDKILWVYWGRTMKLISEIVDVGCELMQMAVSLGGEGEVEAGYCAAVVGGVRSASSVLVCSV